MENNGFILSIKEKIIEIFEQYLENNIFYGIYFIVLTIILLALISKIKRKKEFVPILTKEQCYQQTENLLDYYIENKNWNEIKALLNDSSYNQIHDRAKKILKENNQII